MNITLSFGPLNEQIMKLETTRNQESGKEARQQEARKRNQDSKIQEARQKESFENRKALIDYTIRAFLDVNLKQVLFLDILLLFFLLLSSIPPVVKQK